MTSFLGNFIQLLLLLMCGPTILKTKNIMLFTDNAALVFVISECSSSKSLLYVTFRHKRSFK